MFATETVFISEQITEYKFGGLLEISHKFGTKLNVCSYMILQFSLNSLENFITVFMTLKNAVARYACLKDIVLYIV